MSKNQATYDKLCLIRDSILQINTYAENIHCPDEFLRSPDGMLRLDGCVMRLQVIGETVRSLLAEENNPLEVHTEIPWHQIVGLRNIISHEYISVDEGLIYNIIKNDLPNLLFTITHIITGIE